MALTEKAEPRPLPLEPPTELPRDSVGYRVKRKLLGPPLHTEQLDHERLGKPTALAVFASDNLSSSAYATEEILRVLVPAVGLAAFSLVVPITVAMLVVLGFLILSYRQTIKAYPTAGGAYMVTRDNFGLLPAQVAGVALLTDYVLTVSVSVAAGTAAMASAFPVLTPYVVPISVSFVVLIAFGNLRGVRESGRVFAVPTYFFILNMVVLLGWGMFQLVDGSLPQAAGGAEGMVHFGSAGNGIFLGATLFVVLHAFASGGAAVTGVEAISNGVPAFRKPAWKNARTTLVIMGSLLGAMFLGLSVLASHMHVAPFVEGTPTVISQIGDLVYGGSPLGRFLYFSLQAGTVLILVLAANTSFADFPRLASFHAGDNFMPRQLTKRGHRLVFSNGIIFLSVAAIVLLVLTGAKVDRLIPLYAIGVFTSFTLSQAGMAKHHITQKEPGWRWGLFVNGTGAVLSFVVDIVIAATKFTHGAWLIVVLVPVMVVFLVRLARQYEGEDRRLEAGVPAAVRAPVMRKLAVLVFIDRLDLAAARALQFGRSLHPDDLRAVHFVVDQQRADELSESWRDHGLASIGLELVDCPDRRLTRSAMTTVAHALADGQTEVCVVLPDRRYGGFWRRILHDQTAEALARDISRLQHVTVTTVPFHLDEGDGEIGPTLTDFQVPDGAGVSGAAKVKRRATRVSGDGARSATASLGTAHVRIADVEWRHRVCVTGTVSALRVQPVSGTCNLECTLVDDTGGISVLFLGRRTVPGIEIGTVLTVEGMVVDHHGRLAILNPVYGIDA
ncbi:MAG TPA: APC family permease [Acidimicrobiia bacterium]|nr:APC family permease [Acidimicrobiia bacterium]